MTSKSKKRAAKRAAIQEAAASIDTAHPEEEETKKQKSPPPPPPPLRLAVFDLDYTIWKPEMYQIAGPPKLTEINDPKNRRITPAVLEEAKTNKEGYILTDRSHTPMQVFKGASFALREMEQLKECGYDIQAAVASKTDVESWAKICMDHLIIDDDRDTSLRSCFGNGKLVEISYGSKTNHFKRLHKKTGIPFEQMAFFDNEYGNIRSVSSLGVKCYYTPRGMTHEAWEKAKEDFGIDTNALELSELED